MNFRETIREIRNIKIGQLFIYSLLVFYITSMIWVNSHSALWYRMDCFTYTYEGRVIPRSAIESWLNWLSMVSPPTPLLR